MGTKVCFCELVPYAPGRARPVTFQSVEMMTGADSSGLTGDESSVKNRQGLCFIRERIHSEINHITVSIRHAYFLDRDHDNANQWRRNCFADGWQ